MLEKTKEEVKLNKKIEDLNLAEQKLKNMQSSAQDTYTQIESQIEAQRQLVWMLRGAVAVLQEPPEETPREDTNAKD